MVRYANRYHLSPHPMTPRKPRKVALYVRVSTKDQDLALQLDALHAAGCTRIS